MSNLPDVIGGKLAATGSRSATDPNLASRLTESDSSEFPPSAALAKSLDALQTEQAAIDRAAAERFAQLRAIQDRD